MAQMMIQDQDRSWTVDLPRDCPRCHVLIHLSPSLATVVSEHHLELVFVCPNPDCRKPFMLTYYLREDGLTELVRRMPETAVETQFPRSIELMSPDFVTIFRQAWVAKAAGLTQICGPGFRKALEYLLKDYARQIVPRNTAQWQAIDQIFVGEVIARHIADPRIQLVAKRALWLGNDETHYSRKWASHDIEDLIVLIQLTVHWIEMDRLSADYVSGMPG